MNIESINVNDIEEEKKGRWDEDIENQLRVVTEKEEIDWSKQEK
jgi:hypothetical protein